MTYLCTCFPRAFMRRVFGADAPTKDEAVWVVGRKVGGIGDDGVEALSDALVLTGGSECACAQRKGDVPGVW